MPRYSGQNTCSVKFDCPSDLRARFIAACDAKGVSQSEAMRLFMAAWADEVEAEQRGETTDEGVAHG